MTKPVILTGLRANNDLTIGNYFGGMMPIINMANEQSASYQINMFIPDLHSFTTPVDHSVLNEQIMNAARLFVAAGLPLDNPSVHLYRQSYISAHSELTWILDCFTGFGEMSRMTQFKDKSGSIGDDRISVGLFNYPVLMAADILLYNAKYVPVGDDQTQHLEFARDIAERMNGQFGNIFTVPEPVAEQNKFFGKNEGIRIKDLVDPSKKMSKSDDSGKGVIFLTESPESAAKKIMGATTDDKAMIKFDRDEQPGVSNLIEIYSLVTGKSIESIELENQGQSSYGEFKKEVAAKVGEFLTDFQAKLANVDNNTVEAKLQQSEAAMRSLANETLLRVQRAVGLRPRA